MQQTRLAGLKRVCVKLRSDKVRSAQESACYLTRVQALGHGSRGFFPFSFLGDPSCLGRPCPETSGLLDLQTEGRCCTILNQHSRKSDIATPATDPQTADLLNCTAVGHKPTRQG